MRPTDFGTGCGRCQMTALDLIAAALLLLALAALAWPGKQ